MADGSAVRAGRAFVELYADDSKLVRGLRAVQGKLNAWGAGIKSLGAKLFALGLAGKAAFDGLAYAFAESGAAMLDMSEQSGISVEALSSFKYAAIQTGGTIEDVATGLKKMQKSLVEAASGSQEAKQALANIHLTIDQLRKLSPEEQFRSIAAGISALPNPANRTAAALALMGKSATTLIPMMMHLKENEDRFKELGLGSTKQGAEDAKKLSKALTDMQLVFKKVMMTIGSAASGELYNFTTLMAKGAMVVLKFTKEHKGLIISAVKLTGVVIAAGAAIYVVGAAVSVLGSAFGVLATIIPFAVRGFSLMLTVLKGTVSVLSVGVGAILKFTATMLMAALGWVIAAAKATIANLALGASWIASLGPIALLGIGLAALAGYVLYASGVFSGWFDAMKAGWSNLKTDGLAAFGAIRSALEAGDITAAWSVVVAFIALEWKRGISYLQGRWQEFKAFILMVFNNASASLADVWFGTMAVLESAWVDTVGFFDSIWVAFINSTSMAWQKLVNALMTSDIAVKLMVMQRGISEEEARATIAEYQAIDAEIAADGNAKRSGELKTRQGGRDKRKQGIWDDNQSNMQGVEQQRAAEENAIRADADRRLADIQADLNQKKIDFAEAVKRANAAGLAGARGAKSAATEGVESAKSTLTTAGTFNASSVRGLGADSVAGRTAKATERTAKAVERMDRRALQDGNAGLAVI